MTVACVLDMRYYYADPEPPVVAQMKAAITDECPFVVLRQDETFTGPYATYEDALASLGY